MADLTEHLSELAQSIEGTGWERTMPFAMTPAQREAWERCGTAMAAGDEPATQAWLEWFDWAMAQPLPERPDGGSNFWGDSRDERA